MGDGKTKITALLYRLLRTTSVSVCLVLVLGSLVWLTWRTAPHSGATLAVSTSVANAVAFTAVGTPTATLADVKTPTSTRSPLPTPYDVLQQEPYIRATAYAIHCDPRNSSHIWPGRLCSELKYQVLEREQAQVAASQTAAAPTEDPLHTATPEPTQPTQPLPSPYTLSATDMVIGTIDLAIRGGGDPHSLWTLGTVVGSRGEPYDIKLWGDSFTRDGQTKSTIGIEYMAMPDQPFERDRAMDAHVWVSPRDIGAITITAVSGQKGIVSFVGEHGEHGTFDLATEQWAFEDMQTPVLQTAVATQQPAVP